MFSGVIVAEKCRFFPFWEIVGPLRMPLGEPPESLSSVRWNGSRAVPSTAPTSLGRVRRGDAVLHRAVKNTSDKFYCALSQLPSRYLKGAKAHGWRTQLWTAERAAALIERHFGIRFHPEHVRKILKHRLKWTSQKPQRRAKERDEAAIAH